MAIVTVYQWTIYDIKNDEMIKSRRWATKEAIEWVHGTAIENTGVEIDEGSLSRELQGMTARNFDPYATGGLQQQVRP